MARPASTYRAAQRTLIRPMGGLKPNDPRGLKTAARQAAVSVRQHVKTRSKKAAA